MTVQTATSSTPQPPWQSKTAPVAYRADIDGLRALAVLGVLLFHLKFHYALGGFLGVDIFFVISGYLIGRQIVVSIDRNRFSFGDFYEKRVRRIIPAILLVLVFTHAGAFLLFTTSDYVDYSRSQIAQSVFVSNFYFMLTSGYFSQLDTFKPILHTWTLSIEEQFYLFAPLVLLVTARNRKLQIAAIALTSTVSLILYCWWNLDAKISTDIPFYNTASRIWQIGAGTLIAFLSLARESAPREPRSLTLLGRVTCTAALVLAFLLGRSTGDTIAGWTIFATLATCGLVYLKPQDWDLFNNPVAVFIGKISFGLYLWHWPAIVFSSALFSDHPRLVQGITVVISIIGACASYWLVEAPIRERRILAKRRDLTLACGTAMALLTSISVAAVLAKGWPERIPPELAAAYAGVDDKNPRWNECFTPANWESYNIQRIGENRPCQLGAAGARAGFALIGDSHANAIMPAFDALASKLHIGGAAMTYSGCPPLLGIEHVYETGRECARFNQAARDYVLRNKIPTVYLVGFWDHYLRAHEWNGAHPDLQPTPIIRPVNGPAPANSAEIDQVFEAALIRTLQAYRGVKVVIVGQPPQQTASIPQALVQSRLLGKSSEQYRIDRATALRRAVSRPIFARHLSPGTVEFIDTIAFMCPGRKCNIAQGGHPLYYDDNHLSTFGAKSLAPALQRSIEAAAAKAAASDMR